MPDPQPTPTARDFMTAHVYSISPEMPLGEIIKFLEKHDISNAPVLEPQGDRNLLVGFVSERDCLAALANESFFGSPSPQQTAATIMRRHPVCVDPGTELFTLASIFVSHGYRHLPVVEKGEVLGIVSRRDVLKAMNTFYQKMLKQTDQERRLAEHDEVMLERFIVSR